MTSPFGRNAKPGSSGRDVAKVAGVVRKSFRGVVVCAGRCEVLIWGGARKKGSVKKGGVCPVAARRRED
jgi:hypothetical protein